MLKSFENLVLKISIAQLSALARESVRSIVAIIPENLLFSPCTILHKQEQKDRRTKILVDFTDHIMTLVEIFINIYKTQTAKSQTYPMVPYKADVKISGVYTRDG